MFKFQHRIRARKIQVFPTGGPEARLKKLRQIVTGLIRYERVEPTWPQADEARQYAERLIYLAVKNGDQHRPTMEAADYWLTEKDLIPKLFQVLVPRFHNYKTSFTSLHKLAVEYPGRGVPRGVLELKGNPWPSILPRQRDTQYLLSNMLLSAARHDYYLEKQQQKEQSQLEAGQSVSGGSNSNCNNIDDNEGDVSSSSVDPKEFTDDKR